VVAPVNLILKFALDNHAYKNFVFRALGIVRDHL